MDRLTHISPFIVMDIMKKARKFKDTIHMEVGEPDLSPPVGVTQAFTRAISDKKFHYTSALGLQELREKISLHYLKKYNTSISPERIIITPGTSGAFLISMAMLLGAGDKFYMTDPAYPCYKNFAYFLNTLPVFIPVSSDNHFNIDIDKIPIDKSAKALIISSPVNPYGKVYSKKSIAGLIEFCKTNNMTFISDEIYHGLIYEKEEFTALFISDDVIVINGFSKSFCLPGLRVGWMILPQKMIRKAEIVIQNIFISTNTPGQYAACEAFDYQFLNRLNATFKKRRDFLYEELDNLFTITPYPDGAFYMWADISRYMTDSFDFCQLLLEKEHVAVTPGIDFGKNNTKQFIRIAYTRNLEELKEGIKRIQRFLKEL